MSLWSNIMAALTPVDLAALERLCKIVDRTIASYAEAGAALAEIRDNHLYRATHKTFEDFCRERWDMTPQHANRIIAAAKVAQNLSPTGSKPATERLARPLAALAPQDQRDAWQEAQQLAANDPVRPAHVQKAVDRRRPAKKATKRAKPLRIKVPGAIVVIEPGRGYETPEKALEWALAKLQGRGEQMLQEEQLTRRVA